MIERARRLVFDGRCLERDVDLYRDRKLGDTAFGVGPFPAATFVAALLSSLRREFAEVGLRVEVGNWDKLLALLLDEDIEFFVADTRELPHDPRLVLEPLRREPAGFYVRRAMRSPRRRSVSPREMWSFGVASVRLPKIVGSALARLLELAPHAPLPIALQCDDVEILKKAALATDLVLGAPHAAVHGEVKSGSLRGCASRACRPCSRRWGSSPCAAGRHRPWPRRSSSGSGRSRRHRPTRRADRKSLLGDREQHRVVDRVDRAVGADHRRRVGLADAGR